MASIFVKLENLDRRYIYALLMLMIIIPTARPFGLPITVSKETRDFYDILNNLPDGSNVLFTFDMSAAAYGEVAPMAVITFQHLLTKNVKIFITAFVMEEGPMGFENVVKPKLDMLGKEYGIDYVNLGFFAGQDAAAAAFASNVKALARKDYFGTPIDSIPMMDNVNTAADFDICVAIGGGGILVNQFYIPYGVEVLEGVQSLGYYSAVQQYQAGLIKGIINGVRGTAQYELLVGKPGFGLVSTDALSTSHLFIILLIIVGNVGYYFKRKSEGGTK